MIRLEIQSTCGHRKVGWGRGRRQSINAASPRGTERRPNAPLSKRRICSIPHEVRITPFDPRVARVRRAERRGHYGRKYTWDRIRDQIHHVLAAVNNRQACDDTKVDPHREQETKAVTYVNPRLRCFVLFTFYVSSYVIFILFYTSCTRHQTRGSRGLRQQTRGSRGLTRRSASLLLHLLDAGHTCMLPWVGLADAGPDTRGIERLTPFLARRIPLPKLLRRDVARRAWGCPLNNP